MHYLITGGCGFIGSYLTESLLGQGHVVTVLDNLSTGRYENVEHLVDNSSFRVVIGSVTDAELVGEAVRNCDAVFHLASAVGVRLIMDRPVETIESIFLGTDVVLRYANRYRRRVLVTSTSEVYGKSEAVPFEEDGDRLAGPTTKHRWAYACAKALDEFLAMAYWKTTRLPVIVVRLFNTVGPRQMGQYGMVLPTFVRQALRSETITVHGDGSQSRCFCHVRDIVRGLIALMTERKAAGEVVNLGSKDEVTIRSLAERVKQHTESDSRLEFLPYVEVYGEGFEDMRRRVPSIRKARKLVGWEPQIDLDQIIADIVAYERAAMR